MTDALSLGLFLLVLVVVLAAASPGGIIAWAREEWRRMRTATWAPSQPIEVGTVAGDPQCRRLLARQKWAWRRLHRERKTLLAGKAYKPALTKAVEIATPPPMAGKVVPIRRKQSSKGKG